MTDYGEVLKEKILEAVSEIISDSELIFVAQALGIEFSREDFDNENAEAVSEREELTRDYYGGLL